MTHLYLPELRHTCLSPSGAPCPGNEISYIHKEGVDIHLLSRTHSPGDLL